MVFAGAPFGLQLSSKLWGAASFSGEGGGGGGFSKGGRVMIEHFEVWSVSEGSISVLGGRFRPSILRAWHSSGLVDNGG